MKRTNIIELKPNKIQKKILKEMLVLSSSVYNQCNYLVRQCFFKQKKIPSFYDLQQDVQKNDDYKLLGRSYSLPRIQIYSETNSSRFKLIKSKTQKKVGLPMYYKNRKTNTTLPSYLVMDNCQYCVDKNKVRIPLSMKMRKKYSLKNFNIHYNGILKHKGLQKRGQIHYKDNKFYLYQSVELKDSKEVTSQSVLGIDIGIKRIVSTITNNGISLNIGSNRFFRQWNYLTKLIAEEQSKLMNINRRMSKKLSSMFSKRKKYINTLFNNVVSKLFRFIKRSDVSIVCVGDVKNIRKDNNKSKKVNQMIHNYWSFDLLYKKIQNKCEEYGLKLIKVTEEYTSKTCPICGECSKHNIKDRIFVCNMCSYVDDRDVVGARNIMFKGMNSLDKSVHWNEIVPLEEGYS